MMSRKEELLEAKRFVDEDNVDALKGMVRRNPSLLKGIFDYPFTILQYAIVKQKVDVVAFLLSKSDVGLNDAILHAINVGSREIVELLLTKDPESKAWTTSTAHSAFFPSHISPLMLAAHRNNHELVKLLVASGYSIAIPHRPDCCCTDCTQKSHRSDIVMNSFRLLDTYRAFCSHASLLKGGDSDPIIDAFLLTRDLEKCQEAEPACMTDYCSMAENVRKLPAVLVAQCETESEVTQLLERAEGAPAGYSISLPRVRVAIDTKQKEFLSDFRCLKVIQNRWMGSWSDWSISSPLVKTERVLNYTLFYPITALMYTFSMGRIMQGYKNPVVRFLSFTTSYLLFLLALILYTQHSDVRDIRGLPATLYKRLLLAYIWLYMLGAFAVNWSDLMRLGFRRFLYAWWRWYDFIQLCTYLLAFNAFLNAWAQVSSHGLSQSHRVHWDPQEPTLIFEVIFTFAAILSSWRLFYFLQMLRAFGPLVISIGKCVRDVMLFLVIFAVVLVSFAIGMNFLYEHYKYNEVNRNGNVVEQPFFMTSWLAAFRYLYWAWYGYLDPERLEVVVGNYGPDGKEARHMVVQYAGELLSAIYYVMLVVALLNLMISIMATTAGAILEHQDIEWKYVKVQIWCEYFQDSRQVPPPLCLLQLLIHGSIWFYRRTRKQYDKQELSAWDESYQSPDQSEKQILNYQKLIRTLTKRALNKKLLEDVVGQELPYSTVHDLNLISPYPKLFKTV